LPISQLFIHYYNVIMPDRMPKPAATIKIVKSSGFAPKGNHTAGRGNGDRRHIG
jgi:hypothetical protein